MHLLSRIDMALQRAGLTRSQLADGVGLSPATFSKLARRPGSSMRPENVAKIARFLKCDLHWLCTGEGGVYLPQEGPATLSPLTIEAAHRLDALHVEARAYAFLVIELVARGERPAFPSLPDPLSPKPRRKNKTALDGAAA